MKKVELKKGELIQRKGDLNHKVYFVESGLLRSYAVDKNGKECVFMFAPERWTIADYKSTEVPAELYIDALEPSTVIELPKDLKREEKNIASILSWMAVLQTRIIMLQSTNAIERYEHFLTTYPDIVQRVPQRMIASYLGVNPETLSAAKSTWLKNSRSN